MGRIRQAPISGFKLTTDPDANSVCLQIQCFMFYPDNCLFAMQIAITATRKCDYDVFNYLRDLVHYPLGGHPRQSQSGQIEMVQS